MSNGDEKNKPFVLYRVKPEIEDVTKTIDDLTKKLEYVSNIEGGTFLVQALVCEGKNLGNVTDPLRPWTSHELTDPPIYHVSTYEGVENSHLYKERKLGGMELVKHELLEGKWGAKERVGWIHKVDPRPEWASERVGLPSDIWRWICSYLPFDKIFILGGMNKRLRATIHGYKVRFEDDYGILSYRRKEGIDWRSYLSNLGTRPIPPTYPSSLRISSEAAYLNPSTLVKWGHRNENTMRKSGHPFAISDEREKNLGDFINRPDSYQLIFVHVGDEAFIIPICVNSETTPELLGSDLRNHARFRNISKSAIFEFKIKCPPKEEMLNMPDSQFELMGLNKPERQPDGTIEGPIHLPLTEDMIDWKPGTAIVHYNARENTRVHVKVFVRRYFKSDFNETHKETIIDRFNNAKYCKHCYRPMTTTSGFGIKAPDAWVEMHKDLKPICIHCFTHLHREQIIEKKKMMPKKCPKCEGYTLHFQRNFRTPGEEFKEGQLDYYKCRVCDDAPKLWCAFLRKPIIYKPVLDLWTAECSGNEDLIPDVVKRARERENERKVKKLEAMIKKRKLEIERDEEEILKLVGPQYDTNEVFKKPMPKKRPFDHHHHSGKKPVMSRKRPGMSPVVTRAVDLEDEDDADYENLDSDEDEDDYEDEDDDEDEDDAGFMGYDGNALKEENREDDDGGNFLGVPPLDPCSLHNMSLF